MNTTLSHSIHACLYQSVMDRFGDPMDVRLRIQEGDSGLMRGIAQAIDRLFDSAVIEIGRELVSADRDLLEKAAGNSLFCRRVKDTVMEQVYGERLCPPLNILPEPLSLSDPLHPASLFSSMKDTPVHAVCLECLPNICNELYPLAIDSYVCDLAKHWRQHRCLIGVHVDWLDEELRATRCIYLRPDEDLLIEASLAEPLPIQSVHFLAVTPSCHRIWSNRFAEKEIIQINPYEPSAKADDKYGCIQVWNEDCIPTPDAVLVRRDEITDPDSFRSRMKDIFQTLFRDDPDRDIVLIAQPNGGTEGRGTQSFSGPNEWDQFLPRYESLFAHISEIARNDDILIRKGIHRVLLRDPHTEQEACFDLRVNIACGHVESGFFMMAAPKSVIASPGRGGHILEWKLDSDWKLRVPGQSGLLSWDKSLWQDIQNVAEPAANHFSGCRIVGIDIRMDWRDGKIVPCVLDINPRPAGLAHSRYFDTQEPGVTQYLWDALP